MATGKATVPNLYAFCLNNRSCNFCLDGSAFAVDFAILRSHFWYRQTVPKMGPWKCFSFVLLLSCACGPKNGTARRSHFWDHVKFHFYKVFASGLKKRNVLVSTEALWLMATGKATREALLSEAGFEKVFRTQNWVRRSKLFCRWFGSLLGQAGCISIAAWTRWKLGSYYLVSSGGLIVCCQNKAHQPFAALVDCLRCFLLLRSSRVFVQVAGFHLDDCIEYFTAPCWPPLPPLDSYLPKFSARTEDESWSFSQSRYELIV